MTGPVFKTLVITLSPKATLSFDCLSLKFSKTPALTRCRRPSPCRVPSSHRQPPPPLLKPPASRRVELVPDRPPSSPAARQLLPSPPTRFRSSSVSVIWFSPAVLLPLPLCWLKRHQRTLQELDTAEQFLPVLILHLFE